MPPELANDPAARSRWSVRVRGLDRDVLRYWECDRRWTGEVVVSLDDLLERD